MSSVTKPQDLIKNAIVVNLVSPSGEMRSRKVTFDFQRHEQRDEAFLCEHCFQIAEKFSMEGHTVTCSPKERSDQDQRIIVIGWSIQIGIQSSFAGIAQADLDAIVVTAQAQPDRARGTPEKELHWNEGKPVPISPLSFKEQKFAWG